MFEAERESKGELKRGSRREPSAVIWCWRGGETEAQTRAREAAAARRRGLVGGLVGLTLAAIFYFFFKRPQAGVVIAAVAVLSTLLALAFPLTAWKAVTRALDRFAHAVGTVTTWLLLTLFYFLVFLPLGLLLRARGKLAITRAFDRRLPSYWKTLDGSGRSAESYRRQF